MSYYDSQWHMHMNTHMRTGLLTRMITQKANTTVTNRRLKLYLPTNFILYDPKKVSIIYKILLY